MTESELTVSFLEDSTITAPNILTIPDGVNGQLLRIITSAPMVLDTSNVETANTVNLEGKYAHLLLVFCTSTAPAWYILYQKQGILLT